MKKLASIIVLLALGMPVLADDFGDRIKALEDQTAAIRADLTSIKSDVAAIKDALGSLQVPVSTAPAANCATGSCGTPANGAADDGDSAGRRQPLRKILQRIFKRRGGC
jgi:hypothetical protein